MTRAPTTSTQWVSLLGYQAGSAKKKGDPAGAGPTWQMGEENKSNIYIYIYTVYTYIYIYGIRPLLHVIIWVLLWIINHGS